MPATLIKTQYGLDDSGKKYRCCSCGQRRFVRMKDFETGELFPEEVGRCDRESNCGYHMTAKQYFESKGLGYKPTLKEVEIKPEIIDYMPLDYVTKSMDGYEQTNFAQYLISLFRENIAKKVLKKYDKMRLAHK